MKPIIYRARLDFATDHPQVNPFLRFAQKYEFFPGETSSLRKCYTNAIALIVAGKGSLELADQHSPLKPGMLIYIPAGELHRWCSDRENPLVKYCAYFDWNYFDRKTLHSQKEYFWSLDCSFPFKEEDASTLSHPIAEHLPTISMVSSMDMWVNSFHQFLSAPYLLDQNYLVDSFRIRGAFQIFIGSFIKYVQQATSSIDPRILKIVEKIHHSPINQTHNEIFQWAHEAGLSRSHFHSLFKQSFHLTPKSYINQLIVKCAIDKLCHSNSSITEITNDLGFSSIHYFSRFFHKHTGMPPSEYRKLYR